MLDQVQHSIVTDNHRITWKKHLSLLCHLCNFITSVNGSFPSSHSSTDHQSGPACCRPLSLICFQKFLFSKELWKMSQNTFQGKHQMIARVLLDTLHNAVNLCLSSSGLPLAAGYSQSRSSPSKLCFLRNLIEDCTNAFLLACVDTIFVNL